MNNKVKKRNLAKRAQVKKQRAEERKFTKQYFKQGGQLKKW